MEEEIKTEKIRLQKIHDNCKRANWMFTIRLMNNTKSINELNKYFEDNGVEIRPFFYPYYCHQHLIELPRNIDMNENLHKDIIMLPSYPELTNEQLQKITDVIKNIFNAVL